MPLKYPLSFKHPRTSTGCFIFKTYPVTKDTSTPHLDYMWTSVSSWMGGNVSASRPQASLCPTRTCFLIGWGADQSHLSTCCLDTSGVVAKHRSTTFTSWTIFLKVRIWKIVLPYRSAEAGPGNTCSFSVNIITPAPEPWQFPRLMPAPQFRGWSPSNPNKSFAQNLLNIFTQRPRSSHHWVLQIITNKQLQLHEHLKHIKNVVSWLGYIFISYCYTSYVPINHLPDSKGTVNSSVCQSGCLLTSVMV